MLLFCALPDAGVGGANASYENMSGNLSLIVLVGVLVVLGLLAYLGVLGEKSKAVLFQNSRLAFRLGILAVVGLLAYFGVFGKTDKPGDSTSSPSNFTASKSAEKSLLNSDDQRMRAKLNPIIKCLNGELTHYEDWAESYHQRVQHLQTGVAAPFDSVNSMFQSMFGSNGPDKGRDTTECADQLEKGASLPPSVSDLDTDAKTTAAQLRKIIGPGLEYESYVDQKKYLDDKFARGRELDAVISPLLASMNATTEKIRSDVERQNSSIRKHELDAIEKKEGRNLLWHAHNSMIAARSLDEQLLQMRRNNALTSAGVQAAMQPLQQAVDGANGYLQAHPDAKVTPASGERPLWFAVEDPLNKELADTRELRQKLDETPQELAVKIPFPESPQDHQEKLRQQVHLINEDFNYLIRAYNDSIHFDD